jgi:hypothetical protein
MATSPIDLSGGLVPKAPPPTAVGVDLSGGLVPKAAPSPASQPSTTTQDAVNNAPHAFMPPRHILDRVADLIGDVTTPIDEGQKGVVKGAMNSAAGLMEIGQKAYSKEAPLLGVSDANQHGQWLAPAAQWLREHAQDHGMWQQLGDMGENVAELLAPGLGEEAVAAKGTEAAVEAPTYADKAAQLAKTAKTLEQNPKLARLAAIGARALKAAVAGGARAGVEGGAQTFVKTGGDAGAAAEAGALSAAGGAALSGVAGGVGAAREAYAGEQAARDATAATRAAQQAAADNAPAIQAERVAAMKAARQATAQQAVKDTAKGAARGVVDRMNEAMQPDVTAAIPGVPQRAGADTIDQGIRTSNSRAKLGSMANTIPDRLLPRNPIVEEVGQRASLIPKRMFDEIPSPGSRTTPANFPQIDADKVAARVTNFADAADEARKAAEPIYTKVNEATDGQFNKLKQARTAAFRSGDQAAYQKATDNINDLLKTKPGGVQPEEFAAAKSAWNDERDLDRIHNAVEGAFNGISEGQAAQPGVAAREVKGNKLQGNLGRLMLGKNGLSTDRISQLLGPEGLTGLQRAAKLTSTPELRAATDELAKAVAAEFPKPEPVAQPGAGTQIGNAIKHTVGTGMATAAIAHATGMPYAYAAPTAEAARYVLHQVVTNPAVGKMFQYAVEYGASPKNAASVIAAMIQRQETGESRAQGTGATDQPAK